MGAIEKVIQACVRVGRSYEILVYDDGSQDRTFEVAEQYRLAHPELPIKIFRRERNTGLSHNFFDGASAGTGTYYRCVAGDDYELPEAHDAILRALGSADIVLPVYVEVENKGRIRMAISQLFTLLMNLASGYSLGYYNGFAVYHRLDVLKHTERVSGFGFQAELTVNLLNSGRTYTELKLKTTHKTVTSAFTARDFLSTAHVLLKVLRWRVRNFVTRR